MFANPPYLLQGKQWTSSGLAKEVMFYFVEISLIAGNKRFVDTTNDTTDGTFPPFKFT